SLGESATVVRGRCLAYGEGITFWPVREIVRDAAGITDTDPPEGAGQKIAALLGQHPEGALIAERVMEVLGFAEPAARVEETFWAVRKLLEAVAAERPVVVVIDDIHWAEPTLL